MKKISRSKKCTAFIPFMTLFMGTQVLAHSPYLLPNVFDAGENGIVTLDATMGEYFFIPDRAFSGSEFTVRLPNGASENPETLTEFKTRTVLEHTLETDGTYRFSTGWRTNDLVKSYELDGRTRRLRGADTVLPEGGKLIESYYSSTMAETYITKGFPNESALAANGTGLEFKMISHPNELFAGEQVTLNALLDGSPTAGVVVDVYLAARQAEGSEGTYTLESNKQGGLMFTPETSGIYILKSRHTVQSSFDAEEPARRYTYTLVLEVSK